MASNLSVKENELRLKLNLKLLQVLLKTIALKTMIYSLKRRRVPLNSQKNPPVRDVVARTKVCLLERL